MEFLFKLFMTFKIHVIKCFLKIFRKKGVSSSTAELHDHPGSSEIKNDLLVNTQN